MSVVSTYRKGTWPSVTWPPKMRKLAQSEELQEDEGLVKTKKKAEEDLGATPSVPLHKIFNLKEQSRTLLASS